MNETTSSPSGIGSIGSTGMIGVKSNSAVIKQIGNGYMVSYGYGELNWFAFSNIKEALDKIKEYLEPAE
jgi:hypothetical protein